MDTLDLLEKRLQFLELLVLPPKNVQASDKKTALTSERTVLDQLQETQTMIRSALCGREGMNQALSHLEQIHEYLNPEDPNIYDLEYRRTFILEHYPEIKETLTSVNHLKDLEPVIEPKAYVEVVEASNKLSEVVSSNVEVLKDSNDVTNDILGAVQKYNDIVESLKLIHAKFDTELLNLERGTQSKASPQD